MGQAPRDADRQLTGPVAGTCRLSSANPIAARACSIWNPNPALGAPARVRHRHAGRGALCLAHSLSIDPALLTCDEDNLASRKVIEDNGGVMA